jgi:hypothetical protein
MSVRQGPLGAASLTESTVKCSLLAASLRRPSAKTSRPVRAYTAAVRHSGRLSSHAFSPGTPARAHSPLTRRTGRTPWPALSARLLTCTGCTNICHPASCQVAHLGASTYLTSFHRSLLHIPIHTGRAIPMPKSSERRTRTFCSGGGSRHSSISLVPVAVRHGDLRLHEQVLHC